eukprot:5413015-Alexandrium_andersonii.AAC.1
MLRWGRARLAFRSCMRAAAGQVAKALALFCERCVWFGARFCVRCGVLGAPRAMWRNAAAIPSPNISARFVLTQYLPTP